MDDFWRESDQHRHRGGFNNSGFDPFDSEMIRSPFGGTNPFSLFNHMQQIHREMDNLMQNTFARQFGHFDSDFDQRKSIAPSQHRAIELPNQDKDLDKQVRQHGLRSIFDDNYINDWDYVKELERLEKQEPKSLNSMQTDPNAGFQFYGKSHFYTYSSDGNNKVQERTIVKDSRGNLFESAKRKLNDGRMWAKTIKQNENGERDEDEKLFGMDDADKEKFMNDWNLNSNRYHRPALDYSQQTVNDGIEVTKIDTNVPAEKKNEPTVQFNLSPADRQEKSKWMDKLKFWK